MSPSAAILELVDAYQDFKKTIQEGPTAYVTPAEIAKLNDASHKAKQHLDECRERVDRLFAGQRVERAR